MRNVVLAALLLVALVHLLPLAGVLGGEKLATMYGIASPEPNLEILLRHRAVLFGLLAGFLAWAAFTPKLQGLAILAGLVSVASFIGLTLIVGHPNPALQVVFKVDVAALVLLLAAAAAHLRAAP